MNETNYTVRFIALLIFAIVFLIGLFGFAAIATRPVCPCQNQGEIQ
jgi:hypothetical protein